MVLNTRAACGQPRVSMRHALISNLKKYQNLLKNWDFYARNGQKLALKATWMKKKHHIWQGLWPTEPSSINCSRRAPFPFICGPQNIFHAHAVLGWISVWDPCVRTMIVNILPKTWMVLLYSRVNWRFDFSLHHTSNIDKNLFLRW